MSDLSEPLYRSEFCGADGKLQWRIFDAAGNAFCYAATEAQASSVLEVLHRRAPATAPAPVAASALTDETMWQIHGALKDSGKTSLAHLVSNALAAAPAPAAAPIVQPVGEYNPGSWFEARTLDEMQAFYLSRLSAIREAAKEHGYAIGLHGSTRRDFDLMAMQWRDGASDKDTLARAIADAACGIRREGAYDWEQKSLGRVAASIPVCWTAHDNPDFDKPSVGHIDLSIIESPAPASAAADAKDAARASGWQPITKPGQVRVGDKLRFTIGDDKYSETAKELLHAGTDNEEIIYNKRRNYYLITSMAIANRGSQKNVEFLAAIATSADEVKS